LKRQNGKKRKIQKIGGSLNLSRRQLAGRMERVFLEFCLDPTKILSHDNLLMNLERKKRSKNISKIRKKNIYLLMGY
jgi:hypothetical protein